LVLVLGIVGHADRGLTEQIAVIQDVDDDDGARIGRVQCGGGGIDAAVPADQEFSRFEPELVAAQPDSPSLIYFRASTVPAGMIQTATASASMIENVRTICPCHGEPPQKAKH
jgi:hypothetical protein